MTVKLGFSPCPNDTFMFYGIVSGRIPLPFDFEMQIRDVEELNQLAFSGSTDISKISFAAYFKVADRYIMLNSGAALGRGCGPLVVASESLDFSDLKHMKVAIPGEHTTANLLFSLFCPQCTQKIPMLFSDIEQAVQSGEVDAGVVIHETRFTYQMRGLKKVADLGEMWEQETKHPIPLGCIAVKRELAEQGRMFDRALSQSVKYAFEHREMCYPFIREHAQEIDSDVVDAHIDLYVNDFSVNMSDTGRQAVHYLYQKSRDNGFIEGEPLKIFLDE